MRLRDIVTITQSRLFSPNPDDHKNQVDLDREIESGFGSDLMSDVLYYDVNQGVLVTGLTNPQVVRTAEMADIAAILMVRDKTPQSETIELARQTGIPILGTSMTMFETCGRLYAAGLPSSQRYNSSGPLGVSSVKQV